MMHPTLQRWRAALDSASLVSIGESDELALANQQIFSLTKSELTELSKDDLLTFIDGSYRTFAKKLGSSSRSLLFYAWFDEMSGTLRLSATAGHGPEDLPFSCQLDARDVPGLVVDELLRGETVEGLLPQDFRSEEFDDELDEELTFVQRVYFRLLPRIAE